MPGVIFDLDGVLVNSEPYWQQGFAVIANQFCLEHGLPDPALTPDLMTPFQGGRVNDTMSAILAGLGHGDLIDLVTVRELTARVIDHVSTRFAKNPNAIDSSVAVARRLADRGMPLAVASSSAQQFIDTALDAVGLSDAFSVTQSALELQHGKPHPDVYLLTLDKMGLDAREAVAIEDSITGLGAAVRAELATIWLLQDAGSAEANHLERLRVALGARRDLADFVRRVTDDLSIEDVDDVLETL